VTPVTETTPSSSGMLCGPAYAPQLNLDLSDGGQEIVNGLQSTVKQFFIASRAMFRDVSARVNREMARF